MDVRHSDDGFTAVFESIGSEPGLEVIDPIERRRRSLYTSERVSPRTTDTDAFPFPVETAVEIETAAVSLPSQAQLIVRDGEGQMIDEVEHGAERSFPPGTYTLEPSGVLKVYLRVEAPLQIRPNVGTGTDDGTEMNGSTAIENEGTAIDFGGPARVLVGCRSAHERPAATVTTTSDPEDLLAAISTFGSALKTTSPERSFASFRGHPPAVELGRELDVPEGLEPPAEDLRIEVPPELRYAFPVAPLAYYLGAPVRPGPEPRLVGGGLERDLAPTGSVQAGVEQLLQHVFLLECVTRTDGLYRVDLHERAVLEERLELPFADLYHAPQAERLRAYLDVPHERIADQLPDWRNAAHLDPCPQSVEALPYLLDDLALVRVADPEPVSREVVASGGVEGMTRGAASSGGTAAADATFVDPGGQTDALEETWVGEGMPIGATKAVTEAFENRIDRSASIGSIDISVICNADAMAEERELLDAVYGSRANLPFDVSVHRDVTTDELADLLAEQRDFLHYVGHIEDDGFECADGSLDAADLEEVGVDAFFLNACQSYEQGMELIRKGAIGGIVTIRDVVNFGAVRIGKAVARLLNCGFPLRPALEIARDESVIGSLYGVVGDGGLSIVQCESGTPLLLEVADDGDGYELEIEMFGVETGMGGVCFPHLEANDRYYLASAASEPLSVGAAELAEFVALEDSPIRYDGKLRWSDEFDPLDP